MNSFHHNDRIRIAHDPWIRVFIRGLDLGSPGRKRGSHRLFCLCHSGSHYQGFSFRNPCLGRDYYPGVILRSQLDIFSSRYFRKLAFREIKNEH